MEWIFIVLGILLLIVMFAGLAVTGFLVWMIIGVLSDGDAWMK